MQMASLLSIFLSPSSRSCLRFPSKASYLRSPCVGSRHVERLMTGRLRIEKECSFFPFPRNKYPEFFPLHSTLPNTSGAARSSVYGGIYEVHGSSALGVFRQAISLQPLFGDNAYR
ncbi:hypothetical protein TNCV_3586741 [Trichonephila clavipes]|nr:hypothetical protein TNCV_3586741 [Trichonephila clavipes]